MQFLGQFLVSFLLWNSDFNPRAFCVWSDDGRSFCQRISCFSRQYHVISITVDSNCKFEVNFSYLLFSIIWFITSCLSKITSSSIYLLVLFSKFTYRSKYYYTCIANIYHRQHNLLSRPPNKPPPHQYLHIKVYPTSHWPLDFPLNKLIVTSNDDEISASPRNIGIYMIVFEQNCNNLKMAAIGRNM